MSCASVACQGVSTLHPLRETLLRSGPIPRDPSPHCPSLLLILGVLLASCSPFRALSKETVQQAVAINDPADARWTSTTWESASTPPQRKVLTQARAKTITGEVVDVSCFLQLGKRGEAHLPCGQKCVRNGQPIGILTDAGRLYLVIPEEHHPRRDGTVTIRERFAELMAKRVRVSGMVTKFQDYRALFVKTLPQER